MKKFFLLLVMFSISGLYAQKKSGVVYYNMTSEAQDSTHNSIMSAALLSKSKLTFFFHKKKARIELTAGSFFSFQTVYDYKKEKFIKMMGHEDDKKYEVGNIAESSNENPRYELLDDTTTILGYKCNKAVSPSLFGDLVCWYTTELNHNFKKIEFLDIDVPGLPLKFMSISGGVTLTFEATKVEKLAKEQKALLTTEIPEGYELRIKEVK